MFFSDFIIVIKKWDFFNSFVVEFIFYCFYMVFVIILIVNMGCFLYCKERIVYFLVENCEVYWVSVEGVLFENKLKVIIWGLILCCIFFDLRIVVKMVVDICYFGLCYVRWVVCFVCECIGVKKLVFFDSIN